MVTAEDYLTVPLGVTQEIIKVKSAHRTSAVYPRYFDLKDPTAKYSQTFMLMTVYCIKKNIQTNIVLLLIPNRYSPR